MTRDQAIEAGAQAAFWSDDLGGHHKPGPHPHTWQNIPAEGRENYRSLVAAVLHAVGWRPESEVKAEALREAAEDLFYDGDRDGPMIGYGALHARADALGGAE